MSNDSYNKGYQGGFATVGDNVTDVARGRHAAEVSRQAAAASSKAMQSAMGSAFNPKSGVTFGRSTKAKRASSLRVFSSDSWLESTPLAGLHGVGSAMASNAFVILFLGLLVGAGAGLWYGNAHPNHMSADIMVGIGIGVAGCLSSIIVGFAIKILAVVLSYLLSLLAHGVVIALILGAVIGVGYFLFDIFHDDPPAPAARISASGVTPPH